MNALAKILALGEDAKAARGLAFTPREIAQQPATWRTTHEILTRRSGEIRAFLAAAGVGEGSDVFLVGAGSSDYVGRSLVHVLRRNWRTNVEAVPSTDLLTNMDDLVVAGRSYLWISFSRSGDSPESVAVLDAALARHPDIRHLLVTCNRNGRVVERFRDDPRVLCIVLDDACNDRGLAMTSSFTNLVVAGLFLAHLDAPAVWEAALDAMVSVAKGFLETAADRAAELAEVEFTNVCFLGTGPLNAIAIESALKTRELTAGRVVSLSESYLGIRHGPLCALDEKTLVVAFLSRDGRRRAFETDLLDEIERKGLGRHRVEIANGDGTALADEFRPPVDVIFGQLLGLYCSIRHGLEPDTPSPTGVISRVVASVPIHGQD